VRIFLVSTPRSGNMWARRLLRALFELEERSAHTIDGVAWDDLPERCIVQLHTVRTNELETLLERHGFRVAVLARHPFDVLISILHFARHEPETAQWLGGAGGDESRILEAEPTSRAFVRYATSPRAKALLSVSPQWWNRADVRIRYEDMVADTRGELEHVIDALDEVPARSVDEVLAEVNFDRLQQEATNRHFWQGSSGTWQQLLTAPIARKLYDTHERVLETLGYMTLPDKETARARWTDLRIHPR